MLNNLTHSRLHELGLNGMAKALELQQEQPQIQRLVFEERLGLLLDAEISARDTRRIERLLKAARLRQSTMRSRPGTRTQYWAQAEVRSGLTCGQLSRGAAAANNN